MLGREVGWWVHGVARLILFIHNGVLCVVVLWVLVARWFWCYYQFFGKVVFKYFNWDVGHRKVVVVLCW